MMTESKPTTLFLPDTSCIVAAILSWHEQHEQARTAIEQRLLDGQLMLIAAHTLVEAYSVLTRLPARHRVAPVVAARLIDEGFCDVGKVVGLNARSYAKLLRKAPAAGIAGGRIYDAVIAQTAMQGGAQVILTFNARHFATLVTAPTQVVVP